MSEQMSDKQVRFARFGIATKGVVYILIGGLTALTAFGMGGKKAGSSGALDFLRDQPFGQFLLGAIAIGLLGYVFWRFYQAFIDPEHMGTDANGIFSRIGYFFSGVFYSFIAYTAAKMLLGNQQGGGGSGKQNAAQTLLGESYGQILVGVVAAIILGKGIYQLYRAYSGKYKKQIDEAKLDERARKTILQAGRIGYTARGIVIGIVSFLMFRAAITANSGNAGGKQKAFEFLQNQFGTVVLVLVALGLLAYGIFMVIKSRYRRIGF